MEEKSVITKRVADQNCSKNNESSTCQPELLEYLSSAYEILRKIFSYLYLEDISNAVEAFKAWENVAEITRKERVCIQSFLIKGQNAAMPNLWSESVFTICLTTKTDRRPGLEKMGQYMRPGGEFLHCLCSAGLIGTDQNTGQRKPSGRLCVHYSRDPMVALRFPDAPNVGIKTYAWKSKMDFGKFRERFDIGGDRIIKCLIILMVACGNCRRARMQVDDFVMYLRSSQSEPFAIGGCVIDHFVDNTTKGYCDSLIKYIVFYGDNVVAASTVLTADVNTLEAIDNKMQNFRELCPVTNNGALFVFRCDGRAEKLRWIKQENNVAEWEAETIKKYFPNTNVIGCLGYGEFGLEHPSDNGSVVPGKKMKKSFNLEHSFSTSLVYVGYKK